jgi:hypothetical protein
MDPVPLELRQATEHSEHEPSVQCRHVGHASLSELKPAYR